MLGDLAALGVPQTSLLVIPNHHHRAPVEESPEFAQWLREKEQKGHEIVLHGFYHLRPHTKTHLLNQLITKHYTAGEGEFFDLSEAEAQAKLQRGALVLKNSGFQPVGFIAPAWLLGAEAENAVRHQGFRYTVRLREVKDLLHQRSYISQSVVYSVRSGWRRQVSLLWNAFLFKKLNANVLLRCSLHPPDWQWPAIKNQALDLIRQALADRTPMTYQKWLEDQPNP